MSNVRNIRPTDSGGGPPNMDERLRKLEQDMAVIKETMATREDMHKTANAQTWKIITFMGVLMTVMTSIFIGVVGYL